MTMIFTDEEKEWLVMEPFNWHVKDGCPEDIEKSIKRKLELSERLRSQK